MADADKPFFAQARVFFSRLTVSQRVFLALAALLTAAAVMVVVNLAGRAGYGVLYSNLSMKDSGVIVEKLKELKVPYRIEGGGTIVEIPEGRIPEMRIALATEGLPEGGGVGFEIFDKTSITTTDFVQNINYTRALEGELARSITQLREVGSAKVHITMPKSSVFIEDQQPAKASVVLRLKPGAVLSAQIVPAIIHLVAQSVEGLTPDNVAVIDVYGRLLSRPRDGADRFDANAGEQMAYQRRLEENYARQIIDLLEPIVGAGKVRADVRLNLDFSQVETKEEAVNPDAVAKVSEQSETSSSSGPSAGGGGVPGVASNVAGAGGGAGAATAASGAKSKSEKSVVNYEVSKRVTHTVRPVGEVRSLSAAVVVDNASDVRLSGGTLQRTPRPRSAAELEKLRKLVQAAVGFSAARGDTVEVANLSFDTAGEAESDYFARQARSSELVNTLIRAGAWLVGLLLLFLLVLRPLARRVGNVFRHALASGPRGSSEMIEIPSFDGGRMAQIQEARDNIEIEKELLEKYKQPKEVKKMAILKDRVKEFATKEPDSAASLIRSFLMEDK